MVYTTFMGGFGDAWGAANYFLSLSEENGMPTRVSWLDPRIREIIPYLDSTGQVVEVEGPADILIHSHPDPSILQELYPFRVPPTVVDWGIVFARKYFRTKLATWHPTNSRIVATQLVARYPDDKKSCPVDHQAYFLKTMAAFEFQVVPLGLPATIQESILLASKASAFIGVCSGMSHLCHSVGVPVHLIRNGQDAGNMATCHKGNPYSEFADIFDVVKHFCSAG